MRVLDKICLIHMLRDGAAFTLFDTVDVAIAQEVSGQSDTPRHLRSILGDYLQSFEDGFYESDYDKGTSFGDVKTASAFLPTQGYKTDYCDRPLRTILSAPAASRSKNIAGKRRSKNNPVLQNYNKAYRRVPPTKQSNITAKSGVWQKGSLLICGYGHQWVLRDAQAEQQMQSKALCFLGIIRKISAKGTAAWRFD